MRAFLDEAFGYAGLDWQDYVRIDPRYYRPTEVDYLLADASQAQQGLGWQPRIRFAELVRIMVDADLELLGVDSPGEGKALLGRKFSGWHRWQDQTISMEKAEG